jgi:hypothetical protein
MMVLETLAARAAAGEWLPAAGGRVTVVERMHESGDVFDLLGGR